MSCSALLLVLASLGIDVGWQPLSDGGYEYIIHLEPDALASLRDGLEIHSQVPPFLRDFRVCRIVVSDQAPPRLGEPEGPELQASQKPATAEEPPALAATPPDAKPLAPAEAQQTSGTMTFPPPPAGNPNLPAPIPAAPLTSHGDPSTATRPPLENPLGNPFTPPKSEAEKTPAKPAADAVSKSASPNASTAKTPEKKSATEAAWIDPQEAPSWLLGTTIGLFVSLGGNAYLAWLAWGFRSRYERAIDRLKQSLASK